MRSAPPVQVSANGGWPWRALLVGLPALAVGVLAYTLAQHRANFLRAEGQLPALNAAWLAAALAAAVLLLLLWRTRALPNHQLHWDGQQWLLNGQAGQVAVSLDLKAWMLLRWTPLGGGAVIWVPLMGTELAQAESGLRAALYCPAAQTTATGSSSSALQAPGAPGTEQKR